MRATYRSKSVIITGPGDVFNETETISTERDHEKSLVYSAYCHFTYDMSAIEAYLRSHNK